MKIRLFKSFISFEHSYSFVSGDSAPFATLICKSPNYAYMGNSKIIYANDGLNHMHSSGFIAIFKWETLPKVRYLRVVNNNWIDGVWSDVDIRYDLNGIGCCDKQMIHR